MTSKRKPTVSVEHRLTKLEQETKTLFAQLREQNTAINKKLDEVSEHLVNALDETKENLKVLLDRKQNTDAIKTFLNNCLKFSLTLTGFTWSVLQVIKFFKN